MSRTPRRHVLTGRAGRVSVSLLAAVVLSAGAMNSPGPAQGDLDSTAGAHHGTDAKRSAAAATPITLRIRTLDPTGSAAADYLAYLAQQTGTLSGGTIAVSLITEGFPDTEQYPEQRIMEQVGKGEVE